MSHTDPDCTGDAELRKRIRTLSSLLHGFKVQKSPSKQPKSDILPFLRHFTTLLTCDEKDDRQAKKVIAVTGSINAANQVRILVASQNPYRGSTVNTMSFELVKKDGRPLAEVVNGPPNAPLVDHIADVWTALSALDRTTSKSDYDCQLESLELFFLSRSYRKFAARFEEDTSLCGGKHLYQVIGEWQPDPRQPEITLEWVSPPEWLLEFEGLPQITSRTVEGEIQWAFSDDTKQAWSKILEIILLNVNNASEHVRMIRGKTGKKAEAEVHWAMSILNVWCRALCYFVIWDAGIVKRLLTKTNMVASITTTFVSARTLDETGDDAAEFLQEPEESKGQQVYRYLKTVIAWHHAVFRLSLDPMLPKLLENLEIGLVEVSPSPSSVLTLSKLAEEFFARFPDMIELSKEVLDTLTAHYSVEFKGCVHAEATLIGLVNYYRYETTFANQNLPFMNPQHMRRIVQPVADAGSVVIAVSKKCCWCCDWLGKNLETRFKLPGTHGIMYAWDPPLVGIGVAMLEKLEEALWEELRGVVLSAIEPAYSRHSSAANSPDGVHKGEMTHFKLKV